MWLEPNQKVGVLQLQPKTSQLYLGKLTNNPTHHWLVQLGSGQRDGQGPLTAYDMELFQNCEPGTARQTTLRGELIAQEVGKNDQLTSALPFKNSITTQNSDWFQCQETKNTKKTKASCHPWFLVKRPHQSESETIWFFGLWRGQLWNPKRNLNMFHVIIVVTN